MASTPEHVLAADGAVDVADPTESDDEGGTRAVTQSKAKFFTRLANLGCIFVKNLTNEPLLVYTMSTPVRKVQSIEVKAGFDGSCPSAGLSVVFEQLNSDTTCAMVIDPADPNARTQSERLAVDGETYVSIRRFKKGDRDDLANWRWDCLNVKVKPGRKIIVKGVNTAPIEALLDMPGKK